jgi:hypothetical protein
MFSRFCLLTLTLAILLTLVGPSGCATSQLVNWADEELRQHRPLVHTKGDKLGLVLVIPGALALSWDIATLAFQIGYGVYPYGDKFKPDDSDSLTRKLDSAR